MAVYEMYVARADPTRAAELADTTSPFTISVRFVGGLTDTQKAAFATAADRWATVIVGDLPSVNVDGEAVDDLLILAQGADIDGTGRILGQAGPTHLRPVSSAPDSQLPVKGIMSFDIADLTEMESNETLTDVITHEMGHVLGIGTLWRTKGLLAGAGTSNPTFTGPAAMGEYRTLRAAATSAAVPVENTGGPGTAEGHWRETVFRNELMSGFIAEPGNPLSRVTVASLGDLGYQVDVEAADAFTLPDLMAIAEAGGLVPHLAPIGRGMVLPTVPIQLPQS